MPVASRVPHRGTHWAVVAGAGELFAERLGPRSASARSGGGATEDESVPEGHSGGGPATAQAGEGGTDGGEAPGGARAVDHLVELQDADSELDRLRNQRNGLPERTALARLRNQLAATDAEVVRVQEQLSESRGRHAELEAEVARLGARVASLRSALKQGSASARDLGAMDHELVGTQQRLDHTEDATLEVIEEIDRLEQLLAQKQELSGELRQQLATADLALAAAEAEVAAKAALVVRSRVQAARLVPPDLLTRYEGMRAKLGGVAVARLVDRSCSGCHLELSPAELAVLRSAPPGSLSTCESCGRILVP
ncbi:MAG: C4-type zinc ribbon domain-containing protein [Actinomycetota bacterium]|nr:C4-type zinc ribbon domain-containing protein [Actinomycetota bacterium]